MRKLLVGIVTAWAAVAGAQGQASFVIQAPEAAKLWEKTAVTELATYLGKLATNGVVKIGGEDAVFHVGDTDFARAHKLGAADLKDEEWVVKSFGKDVVLSGGGRRGTLYAVYHFLEDACGVRWWNDDDEDVPAAGELNLPAQDRRGKPFFKCRDIYRSWKGSRAAVLAQARNRLNGASSQALPADLGGACTYGPPAHCHTFHQYLPFKKYGKDHADWFALYKGKRTDGGESSGQPCLTNPEVRRLFVETLEAYIAKGETAAAKKGLPTPLMYDVSQNDSSSFCECDACRAAEERFGRAGLVLDFVKDVTRAAAAKHPELQFSTLAYSTSQQPPKTEVEIPADIIVKLCNTRQNMAGGLACEKNLKWRKLVEDWHRIAPCLFIWEYIPTYGNFGVGFPVPSEFYLAEKWRFYAENGVTGFLIEQEPMKGGFESQDMYALKFWMLAHLLEDPYRDGEKLMTEFMRGYYGKAGDKVLAARRHLVKIARERDANVIWFPQAADFDFIKPDDVTALLGLFDEAAAAVKDDPKRAKRVAVARKSVERIREFQSAGGGLHLPEAGVSDVPFYELPTDERSFKLWGKWTYWTDPDIGDPKAGGAPVVRTPVPADDEKSHFPCSFGVYNQGKRKCVRQVDIKEAKGEGYQWYDLDNVQLPEETTYVYFTRHWSVQEYLLASDFKGKKVKIRAFIKFQGPSFIPGSKEADEIRIARVIFIPKGK